ncbi:MAG: TIGR01906 family membrane protein [Rothia sp. (in: high G+C Gram-positive bacteria)]|nr:TIGR01906 family membrane protein [Rothia sp. (in: high G+C Gram-positive bacteria)]
MTKQPQNAQDTDREWDKLSPAISSPTADSLLSARRQESSAQAGNPANSTASPWDTPEPAPTDAAATTSQTQGRDGEEAEETQAAEEQREAETHQEQGVTQSEKSILDVEDEASERAEAREAAVEDRPRWLGFRRLLITLTVPLVTLMVAVRLAATNAFLWFEYHRPGFPADTYGFDTQERLRLGSYGLDYIFNFAPHTYLADIQTGGATAFLASEVEHMTDVKRVMLVSLACTALLLLTALVASKSLRMRAPGAIRSSLFNGAWLTLALIVALGIIGLVGWEPLFTAFHQLFFPQGNWQFRMSDTLIRLYPPQFWVDAALLVATATVLLTLTLLALTWPTSYRKQLALKRRAERLELKKLLSK